MKSEGNAFAPLKERIQKKEAVVGVMGLGYVGLPLAVYFAEVGFAVLGFDPDEEKRQRIKEGDSYIQDIPSSVLRPLIPKQFERPEKGKLTPADRFGRLAECDAIIICVPTPLAKTKEPDLSFIVTAIDVLREFLRPGQLIVLESTTYPGTTRELVLPMLIDEKEGLPSYEVGKQFFVAFSPERVDPGNEKYTIRNTPKVIGGSTRACTELANALYSNIVEKTVLVSSTDAAEMTKLLENTFRLINIGLVNELSIMCSRLGVDVWEVIDAAASKPFGFMAFYPGPGLGGHCIPVDPHYLSWKLRSLDYRTRFIEVATEINGQMPHRVVELTNDALNSHRKSINGAKIGIIGVSYKRDIDDLRESPALDIISLLVKRGAELSYHDPFVPELERSDDLVMSSVELTTSWLKSLDGVVIVTDHSSLNMKLIVEHAPLIVDTRNCVARSGLVLSAGDKLFKL